MEVKMVPLPVTDIMLRKARISPDGPYCISVKDGRLVISPDTETADYLPDALQDCFILEDVL